MGFTVSQEKGRVPVTVLQLAGLINLGNAEEVEQQARQAYENGVRDLLIDLSRVESITSAGLRAILATAKLFGGASAVKSSHVKLLSPTAQVRQVITIAGFDSLMEILDDRRQAIDSF